MMARWRPYRKLFLSAVFIHLLLLAPLAYAASSAVVYTYDASGRVITASYNTGVIIFYTYDNAGNRTQQVIQLNSNSGVWNSFNWGLAFWEPPGTGNWNGFNWGSGLWG